MAATSAVSLSLEIRLQFFSHLLKFKKNLWVLFLETVLILSLFSKIDKMLC